MSTTETFTSPNRRWVRRLVSFGIWTFVGCSFGLQGYLTGLRLGRRPPLLSPLFWYLLFSYKWFIVSPLIFAQARRWPLEREKILRHLPIHLGLIIGFHFVSTPLLTAFHYWLRVPPLGGTYANLTGYIIGEIWHPYTILLNFFFYWVALIVGWSLDYQRKFQEGEIKAAVLAAQLAEGRLQALKMQLQPHFLFNTLNSISALLHQDVDAADKMVARLGNFLRLTLENGGGQLTTLRQELEFLRLYLDIERVRFKDRLQVKLEIENDGPALLNARLPNLILQPLVENAIRHGIAKQYAPVQISVSALIRDGRLQVGIADNGPGITAPNGAAPNSAAPNSAAPNGAAPNAAATGFKEGVGLSNTRARLEQLYGGAHLLAFKNNEPQGLIVTLEVPLVYQTEDSSDENERAVH
ncbi:MAG TPA: histidine kinase [Blastocatellia bacterium]|nr:histidine kinase [Blastocatellia bacterium]